MLFKNDYIIYLKVELENLIYMVFCLSSRRCDNVLNVKSCGVMIVWCFLMVCWLFGLFI